ncbi:MAG: hypothetical protein IJ551_09570 [Prevotella sp.]|nr:hypothetical protein [Prevotella sp.]
MRPVTALIADDGTVFLPVGQPRDVAFFDGCDKAHRACLQHEQKLQRT